MKPIYEAISLNANASFKVESYYAENCCESSGWHIHPEFELVYIKNGSGVLRIENKNVLYQSGVLVFLGGNIPHSDFGNKVYKNNVEVVIQFTEEFVNEKLGIFPELHAIKKLVAKSNQVFVFGDTVKNTLGQAFESFESLGNQDKLLKLLTILGRLSQSEDYNLLFAPTTEVGCKPNEVKRLEEIFGYINIHYSKNIKVEEIATKVGLTPNSFSRFFKKMTQRKFMDFVNEFRIRKAMESFNETQHSIMETMYENGFNDPSYFSRQFKKYQGVTPSEYLRRQHG
ncbi:MAG: AraC family transcriptional regulator [Bacteroidota bacterium]